MAATNPKKKSQAEADDQQHSTGGTDTSGVPDLSSVQRSVDKVDTSAFWTWFETIEEAMGIRGPSMRKALTYLDTLPGPITIVETGCARKPGSWLEDGSSTMIWDQYVQVREPGSHVYSVDLDINSIMACQQYVSEHVTLTQSNSVPYLYNLNLPKVDLVYLDSYDVDWEYWQPSAAHHVKELVAVRHLLRPETLLMVDDSPVVSTLINNMNDTFSTFGSLRVGGKGRWVSEFATDVGAQMMFHHYQIGYIGFSAA